MSKAKVNSDLIGIINGVLVDDGWIYRNRLWVNRHGSIVHVVGLEKWTTGSDCYNLRFGLIANELSEKSAIRISKLDVEWSVQVFLDENIPDRNVRRAMLAAYDMGKTALSLQKRRLLIKEFFYLAVFPAFTATSTLTGLREVCKNRSGTIGRYILYGPDRALMKRLGLRVSGV